MDKEDIDLLKENENLVYKLASKYSNYYNFDDLYQAGMIGIIKASKNYKENTNTKFSTYAYKYIFGEMLDYIKKDRNIIISSDTFSIYKKYLKVKELLFIKLDREPKLNEISKFMNLDESYLVNIIQSVAFTMTLENDNSYYSDNSENVINKILIDNEMELLNEMEKSIINYRYYMGFTQSEVADILGVSQVKVSRQEKLILSKMKNNIIN